MVRKLLIAVFLLNTVFLNAQDDDFDLLGDEEKQVYPVDYAFKTTKVVNLQSLEITDFGVLDFKMMHRFGSINNGPVEAFGLDQATVRFGLEYGIVDNLMISMGRSNVLGNKNLDAFLKYRILQQNTDNSIPVTLIALGGAQYLLGSAHDSKTQLDRSSFFGQLIIGRKFTEDLSVEIAPTWLTNARNPITTGPWTYYEQQWALGIGMRQKITPRSSINLEYIPVLTNKGNVYNSFSVGMDVETGGHVFQFQLTNSIGLNETQFISNTTEQWNNVGIRLGFNLSRVFTIVKPRL